MPDHTLLTPPLDMSSAEKVRFAEIVSKLRAAGINPAPRADLITDMVHADSDYADMRADRKRLSGKDRLAVTRALNIASGERRKIHKALFKSENTPRTVPEYFVTEDDLTDADRAWIEYFNPKTSRRKESTKDRATREKRLTKKFGVPRWEALMFRSDQEILKRYPNGA